MKKKLQEMSNLELVHKLRQDKGKMNFGEMDEIFIIILERLILKEKINEKD